MANLNVQIPTLKLNDGTSIPLIGYGSKHHLLDDEGFCTEEAADEYNSRHRLVQVRQRSWYRPEAG